MIRVHIIPDPFDKSTWFSEDVSNVCEFLYSHYNGKLPENTKIYEGGISEDREITPKTEEDVIYLQSVSYDIFVVQYPSLAPLAILAIVNAVLTVVAAVFVFMSMPKAEGGVSKSPNNELARRVNQARINGRIPDIYGQVRSTPDLIAEPFLYYNNDGIEIEECLLSIGRGYYLIHDLRDGETDVEAIQGVSVSAYDPDVSIVGSDTIYKSGNSFTNPPLEVRSSSAINGQSLESPNNQVLSNFNGAGIYFESNGVIKNSGGIDFTEYFSQGQGISISGADYDVGGLSITGALTVNQSGQVILNRSSIPNYDEFNSILLSGASIDKLVSVPDPQNPSQNITVLKSFDLSGEYAISSFVKDAVDPTKYTITLLNPSSVNTNWSQVNTAYSINSGIELKGFDSTVSLDDDYSIASITSSRITLENANIINPNWDKLELLMGGSSLGYDSSDVSLDKVENNWVGWFNIKLEDAEYFYVNLNFPQGLYGVSRKGKKHHGGVVTRIEYQHIDDDGEPEGLIHSTEFTIREKIFVSFGNTRKITLPTRGSIRFRMCCIARDKSDNHYDEYKVKSVYLAKDSDKLNYSGITTVRSKTIATTGALSVKERRLNALVTRKLPLNGTGALVPTKQADQIIINMALDPKIGRRSEYEVDTAQIVSEIQKARTYFGSNLSTEFCYTFDDKQLSFEESVGMVAAACFCEVYRFGSKLRARFEAPQNDSIILFNHRNKVIGSEKRTYEYGIENGYDGITLEYTSPLDDARINYKIPEDGSAINPLEIKTSGIRNEKQAKTRAWREWNKLQYKNLSIEFEALYESEILARNDRILVADNTNTKTQDGEIEWVDGLEIGTSQPVDFSASGDYFVHLQLPSGKTDVISCAQGSDDYSILLSRAPSESLVVDEGKRVQATYLLVVGNSEDKIAFMVSTIDPATDNSNSIKGFNYDSRFYEKDHHFF